MVASIMRMAAVFVASASLIAAVPLKAGLVSRASQNATTSYQGTWQSFPPMDSWESLDSMFEANTKSMEAEGSTSDDIAKIKTAVESVAKDSGVDGRVILAMIMQESHGYVGVRTTYSPGDNIPTAGLLQCSSCPGFPGETNLSQDQITSMISGGMEHFGQNLKQQGGQNGPESIYPALREYNSGRVDLANLSNGMGATATYVSDIAKRLQGWVN